LTINFKNDLLLIIMLTGLLALVIVLLPDSVLRVILGLPFLLFFPGYTLIAALFPRKSDLDGIERTALSFGLSIAVVPLLGLALNYTPWGIRLYPVLFTVIGFILAMCIITWLRRARLAPEERFAVSFVFNTAGWMGAGKLDKALTLILGLAVLAAVGTLIYVISTPKVGEKFTEFYILGPGGKAADYPRALAVGEKASVLLGLVNHEAGDMAYRVEVVVGGVKDKDIAPPKLADKQKWEQQVSFSPSKTGDNQKVEFLLYKGSENTSSQELHLWIDVPQ
jgi:uncharacterized membrane protein